MDQSSLIEREGVGFGNMIIITIISTTIIITIITSIIVIITASNITMMTRWREVEKFFEPLATSAASLSHFSGNLAEASLAR